MSYCYTYFLRFSFSFSCSFDFVLAIGKGCTCVYFINGVYEQRQIIYFSKQCLQLSHAFCIIVYIGITAVLSHIIMSQYYVDDSKNKCVINSGDLSSRKVQSLLSLAVIADLILTFLILFLLMRFLCMVLHSNSTTSAVCILYLFLDMTCVVFSN